MTLSMLFPIEFQIVHVALAPFERTLPAGLFPGRVLALFVFEILRISIAPLFHIFQLPLVLALERRTDRLVGPVFIGKERLSAQPAIFLFRHTLPPSLLSRATG
jgi:hypothetical protein